MEMESPALALPPIPSHGPGEGVTPPEGSYPWGHAFNLTKNWDKIAAGGRWQPAPPSSSRRLRPCSGCPPWGIGSSRVGSSQSHGGPQIVEVSEPRRSLSCGGHQIVEVPKSQRSPNCGVPEPWMSLSPGGPQIVEVPEPWRSPSFGGPQIVENPEFWWFPSPGGPRIVEIPKLWRSLSPGGP